MYEIRRYAHQHLLPLYDPDRAVELPVNIAPNLILPRGTILGQTTTPVNAVQTLTVTGAPTGGFGTASIVNPLSGAIQTFQVAWNDTAAIAQAAARVVLGPNVNVTGGPMPGTPLVYTFANDMGNLPVQLMTFDVTTFTGGAPVGSFANTAIGVTANSHVAATDGGANGTNVARCILSYDIATDSGGRISYGNVAGGGRTGETFADCPAYFIGIFKTTDLSGLTATMVGQLGRLFNGTHTNGVLSMS